jgi:DASS family divalent anion:Na+ symporter
MAPAPIFFNTYVDLKDWWKQGFFFMSVLFLLVWFLIGALVEVIGFMVKN